MWIGSEIQIRLSLDDLSQIKQFDLYCNPETSFLKYYKTFDPLTDRQIVPSSLLARAKLNTGTRY